MFRLLIIPRTKATLYDRNNLISNAIPAANNVVEPRQRPCLGVVVGQTLIQLKRRAEFAGRPSGDAVPLEPLLLFFQFIQFFRFARHSVRECLISGQSVENRMFR
jgi:hypothetical protein